MSTLNYPPLSAIANHLGMSTEELMARAARRGRHPQDIVRAGRKAAVHHTAAAQATQAAPDDGWFPQYPTPTHAQSLPAPAQDAHDGAGGSDDEWFLGTRSAAELRAASPEVRPMPA